MRIRKIHLLNTERNLYIITFAEIYHPNMKIIIKEIQSDRKRFMPLLLLADEQETMINRYIRRGEMFVMYKHDSIAICSAIVTDEGNGVCEIKNLAVTPELQRKGYGKEMVDFLSRHYADRFRVMTVGTGDSRQTISFYRKCGFRYSHTIPDFFTSNYDHPIEEDGKILKDMLYFRKLLTVTYAIGKNVRTETMVSSLLNLWKESVRASHHFLTESDINNLIPDVYHALKSVKRLVVLHHMNIPAGFIGIENSKVEMLFILPEYFGCGFGKTLMNIAIRDHGCIFVDVNEQNPKAKNFYQHLGFREYERTETDGQGNCFPIIKMKLYA